MPIPLIELEAFSTKRLLARLKRLHQCEQSLALSDREIESGEASGYIEFKESPEWVAEFEHVKEVLARREHVPDGFDLVEMRKQRARQGKSLGRNLGKRRKR